MQTDINVFTQLTLWIYKKLYYIKNCKIRFLVYYFSYPLLQEIASHYVAVCVIGEMISELEKQMKLNWENVRTII